MVERCIGAEISKCNRVILKEVLMNKEKNRKIIRGNVEETKNTGKDEMIK